MPDQQYPEPTVGCLVFNPEGQFLLVRSHKWRGLWVVPGGHVELGETIQEAAIREVKEETGLDIFDVEFSLVQEFIYDDAFWKNRHFIFFDYVCKTTSTRVILNDESEEYCWVTPEESLSLPVDAYTRKLIDKAL